MDDKKRKEIVDAFNIIKQVCASAQGNLDFHNAVQGAVKTVGESLNEYMEEEK